MSGRLRMVKWTRELMKNYKPPTPKQSEKHKIKEQKIMKELMESDFHEIEIGLLVHKELALNQQNELL